MLSFILAVVFIVVPTSIMVATTMAAARGRNRNKKILLTVLQVNNLRGIHDKASYVSPYPYCCLALFNNRLSRTIRRSSLSRLAHPRRRLPHVIDAYILIHFLFSQPLETRHLHLVSPSWVYKYRHFHAGAIFPLPGVEFFHSHNKRDLCSSTVSLAPAKKEHKREGTTGHLAVLSRSHKST